MIEVLNLSAFSAAAAFIVWIAGGVAVRIWVRRLCPDVAVGPMSGAVRRVVWPLAAASFLAAAAYGWRHLAPAAGTFLEAWAPPIAALLLLLAVLQGIDTVLNDVVCPRFGVVMPVLVRNLIIGSVYALIAVVAAMKVLHLDLSSFLATSAVASLVLGLALQDTLGNLFAGISLALEGGFRPGDWVRVNDVVGQVREINWRAIQLVTTEHELVNLPNSVVSRGMLVNQSRPTSEECEVIHVAAAYRENPTRVTAALRSAADHVENVLDDPPPEAFVEGFGESAVRYALRFWVPNQNCARLARSTILRNVWFQFRRQGIHIPIPSRELVRDETEPVLPAETVRQALDATPFFAGASDEQRRHLVDTASVRPYAAGEHIFHEGEPADRFFVVLDGEVELATVVDGDARPIGTVRSGDFFGEMALIQERPRLLQARALENTELLEIPSPTFRDLLVGSPTLAEAVSAVVADRLQQRHLQAEQRGVESPEPRAGRLEVLAWLRETLGL